MTEVDDYIGFMLEGAYILSSFAPLQIEWRGEQYSTAEHAYQAAHFFATNQSHAEVIRRQTSPQAAFEYANQYADEEDPAWADKKVAIMEEIFRVKLDQHPTVRDFLIASGDKELIETNDNDDFWGWGADHHGRNELGKIWMKLRNELNEEQQ